MKHMKKLRILLPLMIVCMMIIGASPVSAATESGILKDSATVKVLSENVYEIIDGVYEGEYVLKNTLTGWDNIKANVVLVKPDAKASFKAIVPGYYTEGSTNITRAQTAATWNDGADKWQMKGVSAMIDQYNSAADTKNNPVIAAINGDFCLGGDPKLNGVWTNAPRGTVIMEGNAEMGHEKAAADEFFFGQKNNGSLGIAQRITGQKDSYVEAICGGAYILRNGVTEQSLTDNEAARQRTGIALKINGDTLLITVEGHNSGVTDTGGITVKQLAELMRASGAYNGINMDGGGSTTLVTKRAGEAKATKKTKTTLAGYSGVDANGEREIGSALMLVLNENGRANASKSTGRDSVKMDKDTYLQGDPVKVTATSDVEGAWVGVYKDGQDPNAKDEDGNFAYSAACWYYVARVSDPGTWSWENGIEYNLFDEGYFNGSITSPGMYKTYLMAPERYGKYEILAETGFEVKENKDAFTIFMDANEYLIGGSANVTASAPIGSTAWVGLYYADEPTDGSVGSLRWYYVSDANGQAKDILSAKEDLRPGALKPGYYKAVLFADGKDYNSVMGEKYFTLDQQYKITYMNGDEEVSGVGQTTYSHLTAQAGSIALPENVDLAGHTFLGWYDNADFTGEAVTAIPQGSTEAKTYYGKFEKIKYAVNFDTDGGSAVEPQTVPYGELATKPATPTKEGFVLLDWVTEPNGSTAFNFNQPITGQVTVYAKWIKEGTWIVSFNNTGDSAISSQPVEAGQKATKPADPAKKGYAFKGWVTANGTAFDFNTPVVDNLDLTATWEKMIYTIKFDSAGGSKVDDRTYSVESATFTLNEPTRDGYKFLGWYDAAGVKYSKITKGSMTGDKNLTAKWERATSITTDKDTYVMGEAINVTPYCTEAGAWVGLYRQGETPAVGGAMSFYWEYVDGYNDTAFNLLQHNNQRSLTPGDYVVYLLRSDYGILASKNIVIKENPNPAKGKLNISGYSRDDKKYSGAWDGDHGRTLYEYFYGDAIYVEPTVSGFGVENAWVGILTDSDYANGHTDGFIGENWFYVSDFAGQGKINLNYIATKTIGEESKQMVSEGAKPIPFGLNYWIVLISDGGQFLDAEPFNYRTFNMDWYGATWAETASKKIEITTEWTSKLADGTTQRPAVAIKRVNGHFGLKNENGKLVEITEQILKDGTDYTLEYPSPSKEVGSYTIGVNFPSSGAEYNYLSTAPAKYGLQDGITYYLTSSANDHVIKYVLNGGINHEDNPNLYQTGTEIVLKAPTKAGFVFGGWYTTEDFKDGSLIERIPATSTSEYTVYAKWVSEDEVAYKIQYVLNGGDNNVNNPIGYTGATDISLRPAKKAGHQFDGWFYDAEFTKPADTIAKGTTGNLKLYAKFTRLQDGKSYITTSVKGGSISNDVIANKGDKVVVSYKPNKGYVLNSVTVDGVKIDISKYPTSYTFENVDGDHTISVLFKVKLGKATLSGIKTGNGKIQVSWKAVNRAKEYKVYRSTNGKKYTLIGSTKELKYIDGTVKAGTKYYYKVAAYANGSLGAKSAAKNIKAGKALTRAKLTSVVAKNGKVTAKWQKVKGAVSYKLYRSADGGKTYKLVTTTKKTSFTTKNVQNAKWYRYKVTTVKNGIEGKLSEVKKVNVLAQTKGIKVTSKKKTATVSWNKTKNAGKYEVYRSVDGGKTFKKVLTTKKTTATFKNLKAGSKHQYKVRAIYGKSYGKFTAVKKITVKK